MSLLGFQQALCDLVAFPQLCLRVRADLSNLDRYDLTGRERTRLASIVFQPGMSTSCTLYRVNRIAPMFSYLPLTCTLLGEDLVAEAEHYWRSGKPEDLQFEAETLRFARFLRRRLESGAIASPYLGEILDLELAAHALAAGAEPRRRVLRFRHDPAALLSILADGRRPAPNQVGAGAFLLCLDATNGKVETSVVAADGCEDARVTRGLA